MDLASLKILVDSTQIKKATGDIDALNNSSKKIESTNKSVSSSFLGIKTAIASLGVGILANEFIKLADSMTLLNARIKMFSDSNDNLAKIQKDLLNISNENKVGIQEIGALYTKLSEPIRKLGGDTKTVIGITDAFAKTLLISGASATEASSATLQFAQAMASGKLAGDEFRAITEANPYLLRILANELNVTTGALKQMASDGKLTADVIGNALVNSLDELQSKTAQIPQTVEGALTIAKNNFAMLADEINKDTELTSKLSNVINIFTNDLMNNQDAIAGFKNVVGAGFEFLIRSVGFFGKAMIQAVGWASVFSTAYEVAINSVKVGLNNMVLAVLKGIRYLYEVTDKLPGVDNSKYLSNITKDINKYEDANNSFLSTNTKSINSHNLLIKNLNASQDAIDKVVNGLNNYEKASDKVSNSNNIFKTLTSDAHIGSNNKPTEYKKSDIASLSTDTLKTDLDNRYNIIIEANQKEIDLANAKREALAFIEAEIANDKMVSASAFEDAEASFYNLTSSSEEFRRNQQNAFDTRQLASNLIDNEIEKTKFLAELEYDKNISDLEIYKQKGLILDEQYNQQKQLLEAIKAKAISDTGEIEQIMKGIASGTRDAFASFFDFTSKGFLDFKNLAMSILNDIYKKMIMMQIVNPMMSSFGFAANGAIVTSAGMFAKGGAFTNSIVNKPTMFAHGGGFGVMGEAGPEAILPLQRNSKGDLGVVSSSGGGLQSMKVEIKNESGSKMEVTSSTVSQDTEGMVLGIVLNAVNTNKMGTRDMLRSLR